MSFSVFSGSLQLTEPDGRTTGYERFLITHNPDGSRTLRTLTRSPTGDLLRDTNQLVGPDWQAIEAIGRLFVKGQSHGTVMRRIEGGMLHSWVWNHSTEADYATFAAPRNLLLGFHPISHDAWKMNFLDRAHKDWQDVWVHTVSVTWNGSTLGHGELRRSQGRFEGLEDVSVPAGRFACERYTWASPSGSELGIWRTGDANVLVKMVSLGGARKGAFYELADYREERVNWRP
ncbi:MAG: hypothetical protein FJX65_04625 [Alphaproteobacteria bacterium]|nr:hypothetical protein [Alphaproteobacteria bacterium]